MTLEFKIYVANTNKDGIWIDLLDDLDTIYEKIITELQTDAFSIKGYSGFGNYTINGEESIETLHNAAVFIDEYPVFGAELLNEFSDDIEYVRRLAEENFIGCYPSLADYAQEITEECHDIPEYLVNYVDYERMGKDLKLSGDIVAIETDYQQLHIFNRV